MIAEAAGFLDSLVSTGLFVGFWACPLVAAALHVLVFCRSTRALGMPITFTAVTLVIVAGLSGGVIAVLAGYPARGGATVLALAVVALVMARQTAKLAELAIGESDLSQTFGSLPASPGSKYGTFPMLELSLGAGCIVVAQVTPMAQRLELWAYLPVALWIGLGMVFQTFHLQAHAARRLASTSDR
jgi:hypothetical protein